MGAPVARHLALAVAGACAVAWLGLTGFAWNDYDYTAVTPMTALVGGDWATFLRDAPVDGPSLLLRAPFALLTAALGGGELAVYRAIAVPALLAAVALAVVLASGRRWWPLIVLLVVANPVTLRGFDMGHAEELLGAALAVGAVLAARADRPWTATVLLGLAMGNKAWAALALGPVLVALPRHRVRTLLCSSAIAAVFVLPFLLAHMGPFAPADSAGSAVSASRATGTNMQPWQAWWFLGAPTDGVRGYDGLVKADWRTAPAWLGHLAHPLIVVVMVPLTMLFAARRNRAADPLLLLCLLFALRCLLDPVDNGYYHVPLLLSLVAFEARAGRGVPVLATSVTFAIWATVEKVPTIAPPDVQSMVYLAWMVPLTAGLAAATFGVRLPRRRTALVPAV